MATTIKLKNSVTTTNAPSSLVQGEVAINVTDKKVWVGNAATTPVQLLGTGASGNFSALTCTTLTASGEITQSNTFNSASTFGFKNRIINGAMVIDQRNAGASVTNDSAVNLYPVDRFIIYGNVSSKFTAQQNAGSVTPPNGFRNYLGCTSSSAYTVGAGELFFVQQRVEGYNMADLGWGTASASTVTLSFWVRSSLTGTFGGSIQNNDVDRSYPFTYTINAANTWEQKSVTIAGDTSGTWLTTNGLGMRVYFGLGVGSTYSGTAGAWAGADYRGATGAVSVVGTNGATFYITGVQLEKGSTATSFDYRSYGTELNLCQRYYETIGLDGIGGLLIAGCATAASQQVNNSLVYKVTKRATPTVTKVGTWNLVNAAGQPTVFGAGNDSVLLYLSSSAAGQVYAQNGSGAYVTISIEI